MPYFQPGARSRGAVRQTALSGVWDAIKSTVSGGINVVAGHEQAKGAAAAQKEMALSQGQGGGMPSWLLPVGVVAGLGVVAIVVMKKRG